MFGPDPPRHSPRRRQAKFVRRMLLCVPARVIHHARRIILRLPAGLASARDFAHAYTTARARLTTLNDEPKVQPRSLLPGFRSRPRSISSRLPPRPAANPDQATLQHPAAPDGGSTTAEHPVRRPIH